MTITNGNGKFTAIWAAIAIVTLAFTVAFMSQHSEAAVARAGDASVERRLDSIERKVDDVLAAMAQAQATAQKP
jgi:hypothetical protein